MTTDRHETKRLKELRSYAILDTSAEADFDNLTKLLLAICQVPVATVTLIDNRREWFKSAIGLDTRENARDIAFCAKAILGTDMLIIPDTLKDPAFCQNPMVIGPPHIRFYAGVPLISPNGYAIGTLAIKDLVPRTLTPLQINTLKTLGTQVMAQLEVRRQAHALSKLASQRDTINRKLVGKTAQLEKEQEFLRALLENLSEGIVACDAQGKLSLFNHATRELHGLQEKKIAPTHWAQHYDLFLADGKTPLQREQIPLFRAYQGERVKDEELVIAPRQQPARVVLCNGRAILATDGRKLGAVVAMREITEQKANDMALAKSEAKLSAVFNQSYLFQGLMDVDGTLIDVNDLALEACGYDRAVEIGRKFWDCSWWNQDAAIAATIKQTIDQGRLGEVLRVASDYHVASGERRQTEFVLTPIRDDAGQVTYLLASGLDVTERKLAETQLASLNRALRLLSASNELLVRSHNESELLAELCRLIVQTGGYQMAWVGYANDDPEKRITPVAHFGDITHLNNLSLTWADNADIGQGPAARTIRSGQAVVVTDIASDASFAPWAQSAAQNGFKGAICLPLIKNSQPFGLLVMYSQSVIQVVEDEIKLLQKLADDLAFGIMNLRAKDENQRFHAAIYNMAASVSPAIDMTFFVQLTNHMIEASNASAGLIAKLSPGAAYSMQTLAMVVDQQVVANTSFYLDTSDWQQLMDTDSFILSSLADSCLNQLDPAHTTGLETGIGQRLLDSNGTPIGLVMVLFRSGKKEMGFIDSLLKIFAGRASAELQRLTAVQYIQAQASLLDKAQDAIMVRGLDNRVQFWNHGAERLYGWTKTEAIGAAIETLLYPDPDAFYAKMEVLLKEGEWSGEIEQYTKNAEKLMVESHWTLVYNEQNEPTSVFTINTNITDRRAADDKVQYLAFYDSLTALPNRTLLTDRLKQALVASTRSRLYGALLFIDLDNFKSLNDTLGHDKGDLLLIEIGKRLKNCVRESDSVARFGGDEFVIMLENLSASESEAGLLTKNIADKVLHSLGKPYQLAGYQYQSSASIGVTLFVNNAVSVSDLLKRTDLAMYRAKAIGGNTLRFFDPKMQSEISARVSLEYDLRQSLNRHQFAIHYQPQVNHDREIIGAEALLRWQHPERGMVPPGLFIPVAEETSMILPIGHWVLETACAKLVSWAMHPKTAHLMLSVNVSAKQFRQPDFVEQVIGILDHFGANPSKLELELTESLLVDNVEDIIHKMHQLKAKGIRFALDDFGTGYSSLSYLKLMPLDQLKIDQSFVRDVLSDPNDASIARTIIALAQSLNLEVIAEGVETPAQQAFLYENHCHLYQGYLFSKPLPAAAFDQFIEQHALTRKQKTARRPKG